MGGWLARGTRLRDIEERELGIRKGASVGFFLPHTRDRNATLPLVSELSEGLRAKGVMAATHSVEDMKAEVLSISARLIRMRLRARDEEAVDSLFLLKDAERRLSVVCGILRSDPTANVLEIQALGRDYGEADRIEDAGSYSRLPGTRVLHPRDYAGGFARAFREGISTLRQAAGRVAAAAGIIGPPGGEEWLGGMLDMLAENARRCALILIPAPSFDVMELAGPTGFGRHYGEGMSKEHTLSPRETAAILDALAA
jgi:hypothetical protein